MGGDVVFSKNYLSNFFFFYRRDTNDAQMMVTCGHTLEAFISLRHLLNLPTVPESIYQYIDFVSRVSYFPKGKLAFWDFCLVEEGILFLFFNCLMPALGLHCCSWTFSSCGQGETLFAVVRGLLAVGASLVGEHGLSSWGPRARLLPGMWNLPQWGIAPVSPALAGDFYPLHQQESPEEDFLELSEGVSVYLVCSLGSTWDWSHRGTFPERSTSQAWFSGWISETRFAF